MGDGAGDLIAFFDVEGGFGDCLAVDGDEAGFDGGLDSGAADAGDLGGDPLVEAGFSWGSGLDCLVQADAGVVWTDRGRIFVWWEWTGDGGRGAEEDGESRIGVLLEDLGGNGRCGGYERH